jgi:hypothetical protein
MDNPAGQAVKMGLRLYLSKFKNRVLQWVNAWNAHFTESEPLFFDEKGRGTGVPRPTYQQMSK